MAIVPIMAIVGTKRDFSYCFTRL